MGKKIISVFLVAAMILSLVACGENETPAKTIDPTGAESGEKLEETTSAESQQPEVNTVDLSGQWEEIGNQLEGRHSGAIVSGDTIEIYWIDEESSNRILYWAGTCEVPEANEDSFSFLSRNNTQKTKLSLGASFDDTKEI